MSTPSSLAKKKSRLSNSLLFFFKTSVNNGPSQTIRKETSLALWTTMESTTKPSGRARCLGLADMPLEVVAHILAALALPKDLAACAATASFMTAEAAKNIASRSRDLIVTDLVGAGAPLCVVKRAAKYCGQTVVQDWIVPAARGGRRPVLCWVHRKAIATRPYVCLCNHVNAKRHIDCVESLRYGCRDGRPQCHPGKRARAEDAKPHYVGPGIVALCEAARRGRLDALDFLIEGHRIAWDCGAGRRLIDTLSIEAVTDPACDIRVIQWIRRVSRAFCRPKRGWHPKIASVVVKNDRTDILAFLCGTEFHPVLFADHVNWDGLFCKAVAKDSVDSAWWIAGVRGLGDGSLEMNDDIQASVVLAAQRGHLATVTLAHSLWPRSAFREVLVAAATKGHVSILEWAATVEPSTPVRGWPSLTIGFAAAVAGRDDAVRWIAHRPDAGLNISVGAARAALEHGHAGIALTLHEVGIAPFDRWDSLSAAVSGGDVDAIKTVADNGGKYGVPVMIEAVRAGDPDAIALLCDIYGIADAQAAVDAVAGKVVHGGAIEWLRTNVPGLCIADARACRFDRGADIGPCLCPSCADTLDDDQQHLVEEIDWHSESL